VIEGRGRGNGDIAAGTGLCGRVEAGVERARDGEGRHGAAEQWQRNRRRRWPSAGESYSDTENQGYKGPRSGGRDWRRFLARYVDGRRL
jgi:hypothetical protein